MGSGVWGLGEGWGGAFQCIASCGYDCGGYPWALERSWECAVLSETAN